MRDARGIRSYRSLIVEHTYDPCVFYSLSLNDGARFIAPGVSAGVARDEEHVHELLHREDRQRIF
jgi:hypothetical protein